MNGICFIEPLFNKVIAGEKTQTRRILPIQPVDNHKWQIGTLMDSTAKEDKRKKGKNHYIILENEFTIKEVDDRYFSPKYKLGEVVYLKEPYFDFKSQGVAYIDIAYKFTNPNALQAHLHAKWSNKLFMPESAARYFIKITGLRIERLQDISEEDCFKEGIESFTKDNQIFKFGLDGWNWSDMPRTLKNAYAALIDKIGGKGTWKSNPYVWIYDFELITK